MEKYCDCSNDQFFHLLLIFKVDFIKQNKQHASLDFTHGLLKSIHVLCKVKYVLNLIYLEAINLARFSHEKREFINVTKCDKRVKVSKNKLDVLFLFKLCSFQFNDVYYCYLISVGRNWFLQNLVYKLFVIMSMLKLNESINITHIPQFKNYFYIFQATLSQLQKIRTFYLNFRKESFFETEFNI